MITIRLPRISFTDNDGNTDWFTFADLFWGQKSPNYWNNLNKNIDNIKEPLLQYIKSDSGWANFNALWTLPNLPYQTTPPTKVENWIDTFPTRIDPNFNQKLANIPKTEITPIHPALDTPAVVPDEVIDINPNYPPFYNKYLYAKKKAGLA
jgi:hypothetical protein